ncbi:hypothetical protein MTR67_033818 [Solanum verrucosum]|uniref:Uncharacterized protein n=1 Tax=Solanum verrucosum TaxID=315347 RepID=A0AAF0U6Q7_SOLVR|nr:hypothetical protein MTR67_033818 [Solanum verrucosum]
MEGKDPAKIIKDGLSKTLVFYYPLAGRLIEGPNKKLMVNCNSEGIMFIEVDANVELDKLGDSIKPPCPYLDLLLNNVPVNMRGKSLRNDQLPAGYYGNAFVTPAVVAKAGLLCSNPLTYAVELVKKVKNQINEEYIRSFTDLIVIKGRPELTKSWNFIVSDNRYVGLDEFDFGWGKPIFGGVSKAESFISFIVPVKNDKGEKGKDPAKFIKDGLSKALVFYYPLAGRLIEGLNKKHMVNCNSEGIMFIEADANIELDKLGDSIKPPCPFLDLLLHNVPSCDGIIGCPLLLVQIVNHTMMDGYGFKMFLNALIELIQGASTPSILPVWQRDLLSARSSPSITCTHHEFDEKIESKIAWESMKDKLIQQSFFFGNTEMEVIKNSVPSNYGCTKFELLAALLWKCRTIALDLHPEEIVRLTYPINIRGKSLKNELPPSYYGNAFVTPSAVSKAGLLCSNPLTYAVELIKKVKDNINEEYIKSVIDLMVIKGRPELTKSWNFIVSDKKYVGFDEFDFGWGNPIFGGIPKATSFISVCVPIKNDKGEKGISIAINLPPLAMKKFQEVVYKMTLENMEGVNII